MKKWIIAAMAALVLAGCSGEKIEEDLKEYEEYDVLSDQLDLSMYEATLETDNSGTRVLIFSTEDGQKTHKSVYVKENHHLKIISFDDDGVLYDNTIE